VLRGTGGADILVAIASGAVTIDGRHARERHRLPGGGNAQALDGVEASTPPQGTVGRTGRRARGAIHVQTTIDVRRADTRPHTQLGWLDSWHSFSFGGHHDPSNTHHGLLLVSNDDTVAPGGGFGTHAHRDMEIVTWVLSGRLRHTDSEGNDGEIYPGLAQRMSAGRGIAHSEANASDREPVRFVQMWVPPDVTGIAPGYEQVDVNEALRSGGLHPIASGRGHEGAVAIHQAGAVLWAGRLGAGEVVTVPEAPHVHLFIARGDAELDGSIALGQGDAVRLTAAGAPVLVAGRDGAEVLVWATD
jgi:redox-sensitive bicupin YhaK (pirin superfamily)